jgi:hypothetical protein
MAHRSVFVSALFSGLIACFPSGPDFAPPHRPVGVRVLGVVAEPASGTPGGQVHLQLEAFDGAPLIAEVQRAAGTMDAGAEPSDGSPTALSVAWFGGCHNPPGDTQSGCYGQLRQIAGQLPEPLPEQGSIPAEQAPFFGVGGDFTVSIPADILEGRRLMTQAPAFGVSFSFFAVCRGVLRPALEETAAVPLACHDRESGERLGSDAFVSGFVTTYTYENGVNHSPELIGARIDGVEPPRVACATDSDCSAINLGGIATACGQPLTAATSLDGVPEPRRCLPVATACTAGPCDTHELWPELSPSSVEADPGAAPPGSAPPDEILWVKYFGFGGFSRTEVLINDRATGFNPDYALRWAPPPIASESPVPVWAIVQDNRGGTAVARWDFLVRE